MLAIVGDADLLEQALSSVAQNAMQHTDSGRVTMRGRRENGSVVIEVADTGSGIPAPDRARIFDRFYRAGDRDGGFGLGLSIAREAVRTLGGEIELESEQSVGTSSASRWPPLRRRRGLHQCSRRLRRAYAGPSNKGDMN